MWNIVFWQVLIHFVPVVLVSSSLQPRVRWSRLCLTFSRIWVPKEIYFPSIRLWRYLIMTLLRHELTEINACMIALIWELEPLWKVQGSTLVCNKQCGSGDLRKMDTSPTSFSKKQGHMPIILPQNKQWQKKEETNVERWGQLGEVWR